MDAIGDMNAMRMINTMDDMDAMRRMGTRARCDM